jgi:hypothetical protein
MASIVLPKNALKLTSLQNLINNTGTEIKKQETSGPTVSLKRSIHPFSKLQRTPTFLYK